MSQIIKTCIVTMLFTLASIGGFSTSAEMVPIFEDDFENGADALWGNERGGWIVDNGQYRSTAPDNNPLTLSSLPFDLDDFIMDVDIENVADGGIWLRAEFDANNNPLNGVLLVTGGFGGNFGGFYFHTVTNGAFSSPLNQTGALFSPGLSDIDIRILVEGDQYDVFLNGDFENPVAGLNYSALSSGQTGLYDFSAQAFDNVRITAIPEPGSLCLLAIGGLSMLSIRHRNSQS